MQVIKRKKQARANERARIRQDDKLLTWEIRFCVGEREKGREGKEEEENTRAGTSKVMVTKRLFRIQVLIPELNHSRAREHGACVAALCK